MTDIDIKNRLEKAEAERDRLLNLINRPEIEDFAQGVQLEASHQRERWGADHDDEKDPQDWCWLIGHLAGKALRAHLDRDWDKARHHTISTAAVLAHWHARISAEVKTSCE